MGIKHQYSLVIPQFSHRSFINTLIYPLAPPPSLLSFTYHRVLASGEVVSTNFHFCDRFEKLLLRVLKNANDFSKSLPALMSSFKQQIRPARKLALTLFNSSSTMHSPRFSFPFASSVSSSQNSVI